MKDPFRGAKHQPMTRVDDDPEEPPLEWTPPLGRLRRLGVGERIVAWLAGQWEQMEPADRAEAAEQLAVMSDAEVAATFVTQVPPDGPAADVLAWVEAQETPTVAAAFALAVEEAQAKPRASLVSALRSAAG